MEDFEKGLSLSEEPKKPGCLNHFWGYYQKYFNAMSGM
jgi:hypothetical protein